ncbi:MAG: hypothetical protein FJW31_19415 [Acidobacteria bacterium]|nr:hypothetical protein [Acidobacteriota bacterium]
MKKWMMTVAVAALALTGWQVAAQVSKGKTRPLETKTWMKTINGPHCSAAAKMLKGAPADDKEWADLVVHGQMLSEAGHVLMADGRCPDKAWADASKQLQDGGTALASAAAAKNVDEAKAALNNSVLASCKGCHSLHKMKK